MDSQGHTRNVGPRDPPAMGAELGAQGSTIPPPAFFPGFPPHSSQMPFLYAHSFMRPPPPVGFAPPIHGIGSGFADIGASQSRSSQEFGSSMPKSNKKRRVVRKKPEIVELDDVKDDVEVLKTSGHWKDHWVIQLITIRGEMHSIFSAPPKQGDVCHS